MSSELRAVSGASVAYADNKQACKDGLERLSEAIMGRGGESRRQPAKGDAILAKNTSKTCIFIG